MASLIHLTSTSIIPTPNKMKPQIKSYLKNPLMVLPNVAKLYHKKSVLHKINKLTTIPLIDDSSNPTITITNNPRLVVLHDSNATPKMHTMLELISDRIEMHHNICEQRDNWNSLLLNSINMITLTATSMVGVAGVIHDGDHVLPLTVSSALLFTAATGMLLIMNKIQPSQLVEEQRNAVRLFKQLKTQVENSLMRENTTEEVVTDVFGRVLALDRAYPLPLLGSMLEKFPQEFKPSVWWPAKKPKPQAQAQAQAQVRAQKNGDNNGWSEELEEEMREIVKVIKKKDIEDYERLGSNALKLNKMLASMGPILTGVAAMGSAFVGHSSGPWAGLVGAAAGSVASVVNTIEHGGQVGMVFEMYRNCAGFFSLVEETVESNLEEADFDKRENGELFEMKMALNLGRSLSELRDLANSSKTNGGVVDQFASKLF